MESDPIDIASEREEIARQASIAACAKEIPAGVAGECEWCGNEHPRLINRACPRCRDAHKLR